MREEALLFRHQDDWKRLYQLSLVARKSGRKQSPEDLKELVRLYRRASGDLAWLATHSGNREVVDYLNSVVVHAYGTIYRRPRVRARDVVQLALWRAADTVRRRAWFVALPIGLFFAMTGFAVWIMETRPELRSYFVPPMAEAGFEQWKQGVHEPRTFGESISASFFYASNNPRVSLIYMAVGPVTLGVSSFLFLWMNSAMLGALGSDMAGVGHLDFLLISVMPHGITEIGGIMFSVAAGFLAGWAVINPCRNTRGESLRQAGSDILTLVLIAFVMTFMAAPIEGFISFNPYVPNFLKITIASVSLLFWIVFYTGYGRWPEPEP